ncbi:MAG: hypothetical protein KKB51_18145 [Candidatus Riflebacteria bacterium]|nr:hypothetical protein [Candidatus Riflebacteria bacterium]
MIEIHTGRISQFMNSFARPIQKQSQSAEEDLLNMAEEDPGKLSNRWEKLSQNQDYETIINETEGRNDTLAIAYRTLAIFESGKHPILLFEAMRHMKGLLQKRLPNNLNSRLVKSLGDPEVPGPTAEENLAAYKEIINDLGIATQPNSLKKLRELEKMADEEAKAPR